MTLNSVIVIYELDVIHSRMQSDRRQGDYLSNINKDNKIVYNILGYYT